MTSLASPLSDDQSPRFNSFPMRKTLSLSGLFRSEKSPRVRPCSDHSDGCPSPDELPKRRKRLSLRRSPASTCSSSSCTPSSPSGSPTTSIGPHSASFRISKVASRCLFPDLTTRQQEASFSPPQRPACPAPLLDLSFEGFTLAEEDDSYFPHISRLQSHILGSLAAECPSEESFYCRGLQENAEAVVKLAPLSHRRRRPTLVSLLAPSALKVRNGSSLMSMDSKVSSSDTSSISSFETTPEEAETGAYRLTQASTIWQDCNSMDSDLFCPPSPPPKVRLQFVLPPTASLASRLTLSVESNASTLELKETLSSTLREQFQFSISPSNLALSFIHIDGQQAKTLENDRPLYQEGLQDDDEILVRF